jgi:hypothetical protein
MDKEEKFNNKKDLSVSLSETEEIIGRLKEALSVKSDGELANNLGISRQNIGAARKRDDVPPGWIYKVAELSGCSMDWLRFGQGPKVRVEYKTAESHHKDQLASQVRNLHINFRSAGSPGRLMNCSTMRIFPALGLPWKCWPKFTAPKINC